MKRIYACIVIVAALLCVSFYSSFQVQKFADAVSDDLDTAVAAIRGRNIPSARRALSDGADLCDTMREKMNHLLKTEDFTERTGGSPQRTAPGTGAGGNAGMAVAPDCMKKAPALLPFCRRKAGAFWRYYVFGSLRSPISFFSSLKKLSTSANWR